MVWQVMGPKTPHREQISSSPHLSDFLADQIEIWKWNPRQGHKLTSKYTDNLRDSKHPPGCSSFLIQLSSNVTEAKNFDLGLAEVVIVTETKNSELSIMEALNMMGSTKTGRDYSNGF